MSQLFLRNALAVFALAFPIAALAQTTVTGTPTLSVGETLDLDTGATSTTGVGDVTFTGTSLTFVGNAVGGRCV